MSVSNISGQMYQENEILLEERMLHAENEAVRLRIALREIQHRCKNQWQMLSALVDIELLNHHQAVSIPIARIERLHTQIRTIAAIHEMLTATPWEENPAACSVKTTLEKLILLLQAADEDIALTHCIADALLSARCCTALALICAEMVCNATKRGSMDTEVLFRIEEGWGRMEVCDTGPGFPEGFDPQAAAHGGLELIECLCRFDLKGKAHYSNREQGGGKASVSFLLTEDNCPDVNAITRL